MVERTVSHVSSGTPASLRLAIEELERKGYTRSATQTGRLSMQFFLGPSGGTGPPGLDHYDVLIWDTRE